MLFCLFFYSIPCCVSLLFFIYITLIAAVLCIQMYISHVIVSVFQIVLVTRYWTKFNIAALCVSVVFLFIFTRITHSTFLFQASPSDYPFLGTILLIPVSLKWCCSWLWPFQHPFLQELLDLILVKRNNINTTVDKNIQTHMQCPF